MENFADLKIILHAGSTGISSACDAYCRDLGLGVAGTCNTPAGEGIIPLISLMIFLALAGKNPMEQIPLFSLEQKLNRLTGIYHGYKGIVKTRITQKSGILWWESIDENSNSLQETLPLIPQSNDFSNLKFDMHTGPGAKMTIEFSIKEDGSIHLFKERNYLHKVKEI
jgi:hypothetical protein